MTSNSQSPACLCLTDDGIKGMHHHHSAGYSFQFPVLNYFTKKKNKLGKEKKHRYGDIHLQSQHSGVLLRQEYCSKLMASLGYTAAYKAKQKYIAKLSSKNTRGRRRKTKEQEFRMPQKQQPVIF